MFLVSIVPPDGGFSYKRLALAILRFTREQAPEGWLLEGSLILDFPARSDTLRHACSDEGAWSRFPLAKASTRDKIGHSTKEGDRKKW